MTEIRIVEIRLLPWWKRILKVGDNFEAVLEDDRGNRKTVTIYTSFPAWKGLLKDYIARKYCTGNQFWKPPSKKEKKKPKLSREEKRQRMLVEAMELVGESFDCAVVMSEE